MEEFLAGIGALTIVCIICFIGVCIVSGIGQLVEKWKRNYRYKHRFDKPPTARCYCLDCRSHDDDTKRCYKFDGWYTADNWFCWDANPREKDIKEK